MLVTFHPLLTIMNSTKKRKLCIMPSIKAPYNAYGKQGGTNVAYMSGTRRCEAR